MAAMTSFHTEKWCRLVSAHTTRTHYATTSVSS